MDTNASIILKVRKLFALARDKGATEAESALAAAKAAELLTEHKLSMLDLEGFQEKEPEEPIEQHRIGKSSIRWMLPLIQATANANSCYVIRSGNKEGWLVIGKPTDAMVCRESFDFLCEQVSRLARAYIGGRAAKNSFRIGCAQRVLERMRELKRARQTVDPKFGALVVRESGAVMAYVREQFPRLGRARARRGVSDYGAYTAGQAAGDSVQLSKARQVTSGNLRLCHG